MDPHAEKTKYDQVLKEAFGTPTSADSKTETTLSSGAVVCPEESVQLLTNFKPTLLTPPSSPLFSNPHFPDNTLSSSKILQLTLPLEENISLLPHLPKEMLLPPSSSMIASKTLPSPMDVPLQLSFDVVPKPVPHQEISPISTPILEKSVWATKKYEAKSLPAPSFPSIPILPTLSDLQASSYSQGFDTELVFFEGTDGYLFALTLIPKPELQLTPLRQNYLFLIDRSNSIQKERLNATKSAVRRAVEDMGKNDQFNIIVFDQKIDKLAPTMLPATTESIAKAHQFINKIELASFFSQKNLYKPLFLTIPFTPKIDELYTAILITDGENLSQKSALQEIVYGWTRENQGRVSLYTLGMNEDTHLDILDSISNMNRGKNFSSPTYKGLKRKLLKIMKTVHSPVAKNLSYKAISKAKDSIELFPKTKYAPPLYQGEPYVILGTTKTLDDFILFVQAKLDNEWLHIKKYISFSGAKKGNAALATEIAQAKSFDLYQQFLEGKGMQCLNQAQVLLKQHDLPQIFESIR